MAKLRKFHHGTEAFSKNGKVVRTRPSQVLMHRVHSGTAIMPRKQAADRLKVYKTMYGKKAALQIKRTASKATKQAGR